MASVPSFTSGISAPSRRYRTDQDACLATHPLGGGPVQHTGDVMGSGVVRMDVAPTGFRCLPVLFRRTGSGSWRSFIVWRNRRKTPLRKDVFRLAGNKTTEHRGDLQLPSGAEDFICNNRSIKKMSTPSQFRHEGCFQGREPPRKCLKIKKRWDRKPSSVFESAIRYLSD